MKARDLFFMNISLLVTIYLIFSGFLSQPFNLGYPLNEKGPVARGSLMRNTTIPSVIKVSRNTSGQKISIRDLEVYAQKNKFPNGIPKVVHYVYPSRMVPSQYVPLVSACAQINPSVRFVFWSDWSSVELIRYLYPRYLEVYRSYLGKGAYSQKKSDVIRYFLLKHFGGVYMDVDTRCQKPLEVIMDRHSCILSREAEIQSRIQLNLSYRAMSSFMACVSSHRFFEVLINNLLKDDFSLIVSLMGPVFLTVQFDKYLANLDALNVDDPYLRLTLASSDTFSPNIEPFLEHFCTNASGKWKVKGCQELPAYRKKEMILSANAIVTHLSYDLGYDFTRHLMNKKTYIGSIESVFMVV